MRGHGGDHVIARSLLQAARDVLGPRRVARLDRLHEVGPVLRRGLPACLRREVERVRDLPVFSASSRDQGNDQIRVVEQMVGETERLVALVATAAYWGDGQTDRWWIDDIVRLARRPQISGSLNVLNRPLLPALLLAWSAGTAALASHREDLLTALRGLSEIQDPSRGAPIPPVVLLSPDLLHAGDATGRLYRILRPAFVEHLALGRDAFVDAWERWQYILYLARVDVTSRPGVVSQQHSDGIRVDGWQSEAPVPMRWMLTEVSRLGADHPLLAAGYFHGDVETLELAIETTRALIAESAQRADDRLLIQGGRRVGVLPSGRHYPGSFSDDPDEVFGAPT